MVVVWKKFLDLLSGKEALIFGVVEKEETGKPHSYTDEHLKHIIHISTSTRLRQIQRSKKHFKR